MAAFAFANVIQTINSIRLGVNVGEADRDDVILLDAAWTRTDSQAAVIYELQPETFELVATAARSSLPTRVRGASVFVNSVMSKWIESLPGPAQGNPEEGGAFEKFPDALQYHLRRLLIVPLRSGELLGLLTLGRAEDADFNPYQIETAQRVARLLTAVLERDLLQRKLVERTLVERAKGILQHRRKLSEEQAYILLRNNSRRRRIPIVNLAKEIVEATFSAPYDPRLVRVTEDARP